MDDKEMIVFNGKIVALLKQVLNKFTSLVTLWKGLLPAKREEIVESDASRASVG
jgi:hypothetical protein